MAAPRPNPTTDTAAAAQPSPSTLEDLAPRVYARIASGDNRGASELLANRTDSCTGAHDAAPRAGGGFVVWGGRALVRVDQANAFVSYELTSGCLVYADDTVRVIDRGDEYVLSGATTHAERVTGGSFVDANETWLVLGGADDELLLWPRGASNVIRRQGIPRPADPVLDLEPLHPRIAGAYVIAPTLAAPTLYRKDGSHVTVRGCTGRVMSAAPTPQGVALQMRSSYDNADTTLCMVNDRGLTTRVTRLGHATCGLKTSGPCEWSLAAATPRLIVFSGMRGGVVVVDASTGVKLAYRDEPATQFPPVYASCGDEVCVSLDDEVASVGVIDRVRDGARFRKTASLGEPAIDEVRRAWCPLGDLLVPCSD